MAIPSWHINCGYSKDNDKSSSWLFKIEENNNIINVHKWKCIKKSFAIWGYSADGPCFGRYNTDMNV